MFLDALFVFVFYELVIALRQLDSDQIFELVDIRLTVLFLNTVLPQRMIEPAGSVPDTRLVLGDIG